MQRSSTRNTTCLLSWKGSRSVLQEDSSSLSRQHELIQFEEFLQHGMIAAFPLGHGAEEDRFAFVQEDDAVSELLGETHIVSYDDAGELELEFQFLDQVTQQL